MAPRGLRARARRAARSRHAHRVGPLQGRARRCRSRRNARRSRSCAGAKRPRNAPTARAAGCSPTKCCSRSRPRCRATPTALGDARAGEVRGPQRRRRARRGRGATRDPALQAEVRANAPQATPDKNDRQGACRSASASAPRRSASSPRFSRRAAISWRSPRGQPPAHLTTRLARGRARGAARAAGRATPRRPRLLEADRLLEARVDRRRRRRSRPRSSADRASR